MSIKTRLNPTERRDQLIQVGLRIASDNGYIRLSHGEVANAAKCSKGLVVKHFPTLEKLHSAVVGAAVYSKDLRVIAEALVYRHPMALHCPEQLRRQAIDSLTDN